MPSIKVLAAAALAAMSTVDAQGVITVNCAALTVQRADPIVQPGGLSGHVHAVVGGTAFAQTQTNAQARGARATTCDKTLDKSNYWQPQLYHQRRDGKFEMVTFQGAAVYYIDRACDYAPGRQNCNGAAPSRSIPANLRMVTGSPLRRNYDPNNKEHQAISHICLDPATDTPELPKGRCSRIRAETFFPSCWNGRDTDSADHKSHVAYPAIGAYNTGVCPQSHPIAINSAFFEFFYDTGAIKDFNKWVWAFGDTTGYGLHGDYLQGWSDQGRLDRAQATCTGPRGVDDPNCSLVINGSAGRSSVQPLEIAAPSEAVGFQGPLDKLPGNNPVFRRSAKFLN